jgi:HicA toxin of bacterial toxin-antitoxin,
LIRLNAKHARTLDAVFSEPTPGGLAWREIEALLIAVGCQIVEGRGSRVRFAKDGDIETFHRPHPAKEAKRYQVRAARAFLQRLGIEP